MTYDCFSFFNELDLLEIRLNVLSDVVDRFVLVESTITHTGLPKPLFYEQNKNRFASFASRIVHIVVSEFPKAPDGFSPRQKAWLIENVQRNAIMQGLLNANSDDVVLISDLDEIPNPEVVRNGPLGEGIFVLQQKAFSYFINYKNYTVPVWYGTRMMRYGSLIDPKCYASYKTCEYVIDCVNDGPTPSKNRFLPNSSIIRDGGWHYSYLGGAHAVAKKVQAIAHVEFRAGRTEEYVKMCIDKGIDVSGYGYHYYADPIEECAPQYIIMHQNDLQQFIYPVTTEYMRRTMFSRWYSKIFAIVRAVARNVLPVSVCDYLYKLIVLRK